MSARIRGRILGIDYGRSRIGVAVSDPLGITARGLETVRWNGRDQAAAVRRISELAREQQICAVVIGLPRRTDGKAGESAEAARAFADSLTESLGLEPVFWDERYTTVMAQRTLLEVGYRKNKRDVIDQVAAEIILQEYLDKQRTADQ
ncbi:MAG: Holliday junction resolvase RuvX [Oscillospiraceae bacterium]|nr:Holliday junction resolvase RuvX [Oscillospiraceae bacterium]MDD4368025.1 Holliday junction resolvase RuvX [Oscillospiraceae bacterium]